MNIRDLQQHLEELEQKKFYTYLGSTLALIVVLLGGMVYYHKRSIRTLQRQIKQLQQQRIEARELLAVHERIKIQQQAVNDLLDKDKNFKILGYFNHMATTLGLKAAMEEPNVTSSDLEANPDYLEIILTARFKNITMQQLVELLAELDNNQRIYTKELEIIQAAGATINVNLVIATLQRRADATERAE